VIALSLATTLVIVGCNDGYEEPSAPANAVPITITVDLIIQIEAPFTDMLSAANPDGDALSFSFDQPAMSGVVTVSGNVIFYYQY
jgi:hypothetical protein